MQGNHEPIVTVEEFQQVQQIMDSKTTETKNPAKRQRRTGTRLHSTAYGRLMVCQCGNKFNLRFHSRDGRTNGVDYQCYTSLIRGSVTKRQNKGPASCSGTILYRYRLLPSFRLDCCAFLPTDRFRSVCAGSRPCCLAVLLDRQYASPA